ncbi:hypothetical protein RMATCC62417_16734 [Rhizopus microsporus]|nr:hypothetical protein RMATCC62417_16734 [Rhizopus microsporus]
MQIKLVILTICASLAALGFAAPAPAPAPVPAPNPAPAPFFGPLIRTGSRVLPKFLKGKFGKANLIKAGRV